MRFYGNRAEETLVIRGAPIARTGKQGYLEGELFPDSDDPDKELIVDRKPDDVFDEKAIESFEGKPITIGHPEGDVTEANKERLQVGFVENVREENGELIGDIVITDPEAIGLIESGELGELSCGYDCEIREDEGGLYMADIRGNHIAVCQTGRAGNTKIKDSKGIAVTHRFRKLCGGGRK